MDYENEIDIFILDVQSDKKYIFQVPPKIKSIDLRNKLEIFLATTNFEFRLRGKLYADNQIISFEEGDTIYIYKKQEQKQNVTNQQSKKLNSNLSKILHLFLVKFISTKINDFQMLSNNILRSVISELKENIILIIDKFNNIKIYTKENFERNIISYANHIYITIGENEINYIISTLEEKTINEIIKFHKLLLFYDQYKTFFEETLSETLEKSYFEYSISGIQLLSIKDNNQYFEESKKCQNIINKYLFYEIPSNLDIVNNNILNYSKKPSFGMGFYFTDSLDYLAYKSGNKNNKPISVNSSFSCNISQIYYDNNLKKNITDFTYFNNELDHFPTYEEINMNYSNKKVVKNGLHFARVKSNSGQIINENDLKEKIRNNLIGKEYVITEKEQVLPLFNLDFKINESLIIWRDPTINENKSYAKVFNVSKMYINQFLRINAYFKDSIENALELIKRKKLNKIILISNIGLDLSGKKLMEIARKILDFPVIILFFSKNLMHLKWIQEEKNILFTSDTNFYKKYILNYNEKDLIELKKEIENNFKIKLQFTRDYLKFPKFIGNRKFKDIIFDEIVPNFKKVIIKNFKNQNILIMDEKGDISFKPNGNVDNANYSYFWYVTINEKEITLYKDQFYLGIDIKNKKIVRDQYMKIWNYQLCTKYYLIYNQTKTKRLILTDNKNEAVVDKENERHYDQLFSFIEIEEDI